MLVQVRDNQVEKALRLLKKKLQKDGLLRELKQRQYFEKPSAKRKRKKAEGVKRSRRAAAKRMERLGY